LIHRRDSLRAEKIAQDRLFNHPKVKVIWNHVVEDILGEAPTPGVTGVKLRDVNNGTVQELAVAGLFVAIGHDPATKIFQGHVKDG
jgi:thioredoxin reductase (NADPH)